MFKNKYTLRQNVVASRLPYYSDPQLAAWMASKHKVLFSKESGFAGLMQDLIFYDEDADIGRFGFGTADNFIGLSKYIKYLVRPECMRILDLKKFDVISFKYKGFSYYKVVHDIKYEADKRLSEDGKHSICQRLLVSSSDKRPDDTEQNWIFVNAEGAEGLKIEKRGGLVFYMPNII